MTDVRHYIYDGVEEPWIRKDLYDSVAAQRDALLKAIEEHRESFRGLNGYALHRDLYSTATHIEEEAGK